MGVFLADGGLAVLTLNAGGGAGGCASLQGGMISGAGVLSASGGAGNNLGGGGGGGRIILLNFQTNLFSGTIAAHVGAGFNNSGAGTIYMAKIFQWARPAAIHSIQTIIADNGGLVGTNTRCLRRMAFQRGVFDVIATGGASLSNTFSKAV